MCGDVSNAWNAVLGEDRRRAAVAVAVEVAARVSDPRRLAMAIANTRRQTRFTRSGGWNPFAVAQGDAGLAVMCTYLDGCIRDEQWDVTAHDFLSAAAREAERVGTNAVGLFGGLSGLAFAASGLSHGGTRYQRLLASLDAVLVPAAVALALRVQSATDGLAVGDYDLISGLSGAGAYLLRRREDPGCADALRTVMGALVEAGQHTSRWRTPPLLMTDEAMIRAFPTGSLNCGLAHGIPGPLALLSLALREGLEVPGQPSAVRSIATWLVEQRVDDQWGVNWPSAVPADRATGAAPRPRLEPTRSAWCYGSPGVARSLWLAGDALGESQFRTLSVDAMEAVYRRPREQRDIDSPSFCHGVAGLLQITLRFAHDTGLPAFTDAARELAEQLLSAYRPEHLLGYVLLEPGENPVDHPGLLDGAAGVAVVLLAAATDIEPVWDRLFLLA
jgi:hypothetical protein